MSMSSKWVSFGNSWLNLDRVDRIDYSPATGTMVAHYGSICDTTQDPVQVAALQALMNQNSIPLNAATAAYPPELGCPCPSTVAASP